MVDPFYALEKFEDAVHELAVGNGTLRDRVIRAFTTLVFVDRLEVPDDMRADFDKLMKTTSRRPPEPPYRGSIQTSLGSVRIATLQALAERIVDFRDRLADKLGGK